MNSYEIRQHLMEMSDRAYHDFHANLCPGKDNILGIRIPKLKTFAKEIAQGDWQAFLDAPELIYAEETMLFGYVLALLKMPLEKRLPYIHTYVKHIDNWAVCDSPVSAFKFIKKEQEAFLPIVKYYLSSSEEYPLRFAIIVLLSHYMNDTYIDFILETMDCIHHDGYYVKMAVAWTLSVCYVKYPQKTLDFLAHCHLDDFTYNKTLQKACESLRVSPEEKIHLKSLKR